MCNKWTLVYDACGLTQLLYKIEYELSNCSKIEVTYMQTGQMKLGKTNCKQRLAESLKAQNQEIRYLYENRIMNLGKSTGDKD